MMDLTSSIKNNPWYSIHGDEMMNNLCNDFYIELNNTKNIIIHNLELMEKKYLEKYKSLSNLSYGEKIKLISPESLDKIQNKLKEIRFIKFNKAEIFQWCFENFEQPEKIKNETFYYFDLYIL